MTQNKYQKIYLLAVEDDKDVYNLSHYHEAFESLEDAKRELDSMSEKDREDFTIVRIYLRLS